MMTPLPSTHSITQCSCTAPVAFKKPQIHMVLDPACLDQHRHQTSIQHHVLLSGCLQVPLLFEVSSLTKWIKVWGNHL